MRESWEESWLFTQQVFLENYYVPGTVRIPEGRDNKQRNVENDAAVKKIKKWLGRSCVRGCQFDIW